MLRLSFQSLDCVYWSIIKCLPVFFISGCFQFILVIDKQSPLLGANEALLFTPGIVQGHAAPWGSKGQGLQLPCTLSTPSVLSGRGSRQGNSWRPMCLLCRVWKTEVWDCPCLSSGEETTSRWQLIGLVGLMASCGHHCPSPSLSLSPWIPENIIILHH